MSSARRQRVGPAVVRASPRRVEQQRRDRADDDRRTQVVDPVVASDQWHVQGARGDEQGREADRDVQPEDPAPARAVGEEAAEQGAGDAGDAEHCAEHALVLAALPRRDDVADDRQRQRHEATAAEALHGTPTDEHRHRRRGASDHRADQEDDDRGLEHRSTAVEVRDLAPQGGGRGRGQQVGGDHPGQVLQPAEVRDDRGQRRADDALVEGGQEHAGHQADHHLDDVAVGQVGRAIRGSRRAGRCRPATRALPDQRSGGRSRCSLVLLVRAECAGELVQQADQIGPLARGEVGCRGPQRSRGGSAGGP